MSKDDKQQITFEQYISTMRNQIVLAYDGAKEVALRNFDDLTKKFVESTQKKEEKKK
jgi:hypothetical protein